MKTKSDAEPLGMLYGFILAMMSILLLIGLGRQYPQLAQRFSEQVPFGWVGVSVLLLILGLCVVGLVSRLFRKLGI